MRCSKLIATIIVLMIGVSVARAQWGAEAIVEENESGLINYSDLKEIKVRATGIGAVNPNATSPGMARAGAITAARMDAYRRLIETVKGIRVTSETTIRNSMVENDAITTRVEGKVSGAKRIGEPKYLSDTSVEITMEVSISGIMDLVLPTTALATTSPPSISPPSTGEATPVEATAAPMAPEIVGQPITGLIIDARGLGVKPSMSPRILADDGSVLYGPGKYTRDFAIAQGVVGYHKDIEAAKNDTRVAGNPLTIKGTRISGALSTDVVISMRNAQQAAGYDGFADVIRNCHVMFILD